MGHRNVFRNNNWYTHLRETSLTYFLIIELCCTDNVLKNAEQSITTQVRCPKEKLGYTHARPRRLDWHIIRRDTISLCPSIIRHYHHQQHSQSP